MTNHKNCIRPLPYGPSDDIPLCKTATCACVLLPGETVCPGCPTPEPAKTVEEWEKRFDDQFDFSDKDDVNETCVLFFNSTSRDIKYFIKDELTSHRSSIIEEVVRMAEGMKLEHPNGIVDHYAGRAIFGDDVYIYNAPLDTLIRKLREK